MRIIIFQFGSQLGHPLTAGERGAREVVKRKGSKPGLGSVDVFLGDALSPAVDDHFMSVPFHSPSMVPDDGC